MKIIDKNLSILENEFSDEFENSQRNKYLVLAIDGREYAIEIKYIAEIIEPGKTVFITSPQFKAGPMVKHKDKIISAVKLTNLFNLPETDKKEKTTIIINIAETQKALIVDSVMDIEDIDIENSEKITTPAGEPGGGFIKIACVMNGNPKFILNIEKIFSF